MERLSLSGSTPAPPDRNCVIEAGWVLVDRDGDQELLREASVVVRDDRIEAVIPGYRRGRDNRVDARQLLVLPGFISGHTHSFWSSTLRGLVESGRFYRGPLEEAEALSADDLHALTKYNAFEILRSGCTTTIEMTGGFRQTEAYARVAREWGLRTYLSTIIPTGGRLFDVWFNDDDRSLRDSVPGTLEEIQYAFELGRSMNGSEDGRILAQMGPHAADTHTPETLAAVVAAARELGNGLAIHLAQRSFEINVVRRRWGKGPLEWLEENGVFSVPGVFAAHLFAMDEDLDILRRHDVTYVNCACVASLVHGGTQPLPEALASGLNVSLGIDQFSNDYVENIKAATLNGRSRYSLLAGRSPYELHRPTIEETVRAATLGGAHGLRRVDLGRIVAGAKADLVAIDVTGPLVGTGALPPFPLNHLLYANGSCVRHVVCDGYFKIFENRLVVDDEDRVVAVAAAAQRRLYERVQARGWFDQRLSRSP